LNPHAPRAIVELHIAGHPVDPVELKAAIATLLMAYDEVGHALEDLDRAIYKLPPPAEFAVQTLLENDGMFVHDTVSTASCTLLDDFMHRRACSLVVRTTAGDS
jgi:hypothetical protein